MLIKEIITEDITRRGILQGILGAGALSATDIAQAGPGGQHLPYTDDEMNKDYWNKLSQEEKNNWIKRQKLLYQRSLIVLNKLISIMTPEEKNFVKGVSIEIPIHASLFDWAHVGQDKIITIDLGTFWDLSNDTLGYVIGHELGHIVFNSSGKYKWNSSWKTSQEKLRKVQEELDCDTYGAKLAYRAGFNQSRAFDQMDKEAKSWRYNPSVPGKNYYPDFNMRFSNLQKTIKQTQDEIEIAKQEKNSQEQQQAQEKLELLKKQEQQLQSPDLNTNNNELIGKQAMFSHIFRGIQSLSA